MNYSNVVHPQKYNPAFWQFLWNQLDGQGRNRKRDDQFSSRGWHLGLSNGVFLKWVHPMSNIEMQAAGASIPNKQLMISRILNASQCTTGRAQCLVEANHHSDFASWSKFQVKSQRNKLDVISVGKGFLKINDELASSSLCEHSVFNDFMDITNWDALYLWISAASWKTFVKLNFLQMPKQMFPAETKKQGPTNHKCNYDPLTRPGVLNFACNFHCFMLFPRVIVYAALSKARFGVF